MSAWDFQALAGAGGIRSTITDMLLYVKAELAKTNTPIHKAMQLTQQVTYSSNQVVGLGWHKNRDGWYWHNGKTGGFSSFVGFYPDKNVAIVFLTNSAAELDATAIGLTKWLTK